MIILNERINYEEGWYLGVDARSLAPGEQSSMHRNKSIQVFTKILRRVFPYLNFKIIQIDYDEIAAYIPDIRIEDKAEIRKMASKLRINLPEPSLSWLEDMDGAYIDVAYFNRYGDDKVRFGL